MAGTLRSLTVALRMDTSGYTAGTQAAVGQAQALGRQMRAVNARMEREARALSDRLKGDRQEPGRPLGEHVGGLLGLAGQKRDLMEKRALGERLTRMQVEADRTYQVEQERVAAARVSADQRRELSRRLYASTHTQQEVALRSARSYYAQLAVEHRGNAKMLGLVDRTYAAERGRIMEEAGMGGGGRGRRGTGVRSARFLAGQVGMNIGGEIGGMAAALAFGGAAFGAVTGAVMYASAAIRFHINAIEAQGKAAREAAGHAREWQNAWRPRTPLTAMGQQAEGLAQAAEKRLAEITKEREEKETTWYLIKRAVVAGPQGYTFRTDPELVALRQKEERAGLDVSYARSRSLREARVGQQEALEAAKAAAIDPALRGAYEMEARRRQQNRDIREEEIRRRVFGEGPMDPETLKFFGQRQAQERANFNKQLEDTQKSRGQLYAEFKKSVVEAHGREVITKRQGQIMLAQRLGELMPKQQNTGQFVDMAGRWRDIQSAALRQEDTPRLTLEELKLMRADWKRLEAEGMRMKG